MSKESFKDFARLHPELIKYVNNNETTWQKLYELYDIYGEKSNIWNNYFDNNKTSSNESSISDIFKTIKNIDLESVQKGIQNIQKTLGLIEELGIGNKASGVVNNYEPRPMYKYFDD